MVVLGDREFCSPKLGHWLGERKAYFCLRQKCDTKILPENEVYQELRDYGLKPGMKVFINNCQVTKNNGFGTFNVACKWKRNYRGLKTKEAWYILTNFEDLDTAIVSYKKRFSIEEAMQRGLGKAARSWGGSAVLGRQRGLGGFPHSLLPWFPPLAIAVVSPTRYCRGFPHSLLPWFPPLAIAVVPPMSD